MFALIPIATCVPALLQVYALRATLAILLVLGRAPRLLVTKLPNVTCVPALALLRVIQLLVLPQKRTNAPNPVAIATCVVPRLLPQVASLANLAMLEKPAHKLLATPLHSAAFVPKQTSVV